MSKIIIKRPRLIHCWDNRLEDIKYTGFIFYKRHKSNITDNTKQLLNISKLLLKDNKFPIVNKDISRGNLYNYLNTNYNIEDTDIIDTCLVYNIPNVKIYIVYLNYRINHIIDNYNWIMFLDLYTHDQLDNLYENDLYENIINNKINRHINKKIYPDTDLLLSFKIKRLYKFMIGYITVK